MAPPDKVTTEGRSSTLAALDRACDRYYSTDRAIEDLHSDLTTQQLEDSRPPSSAAAKQL